MKDKKYIKNLSSETLTKNTQWIGYRWKDIIKITLKGRRSEDVESMHLALGAGYCENGDDPSNSAKHGDFLAR
jgi:hypothetical protein